MVLPPALSPAPGDPPAPPLRWWALWIAAGIVSRIAIAVNNQGASAESIRNSMAWGAIGSLMFVVAGVLLIVIVRSISARQNLRAHNLAVRGS